MTATHSEPQHRATSPRKTAPPGLGQYIGRVGGLAVALGIGVAIANNTGVAMAETGDTGSATGSSTPGSPSKSTTAGTTKASDRAESTVSSESPSSTRVVKSRPSSTIASPSRNKNASSAAAESRSTKESNPAPAVEPSSARAAKVTSDHDSAISATVVTKAAQTVTPTDSSISKVPKISQEKSTSITPPRRSPGAPSSTESAQPLSAVVTSAADAISTVSAPLAAVARVETLVLQNTSAATASTAGSNPAAPPPAPTLLAAFDAIRRELEYKFFNKGPVLSYTTSAPKLTYLPVVTGQVTAAGTTTGTNGKPVLTDASGDPLTLTYTQPKNGTVNVNQDGTFTYIPNPKFAVTGGTDTFTITADDRPGNPPHTNLLALKQPDNGATNTITVGVTVKPTSPLGTQEEIDAEQRALTILADPAVQKALFGTGPDDTTSLRYTFLTAANSKFAGGVDAENLALLNEAVTEFGMAAAINAQNTDPTNPKVTEYLVPPHTWYGQEVTGSRVVFDNPDTLYRTIPVRVSTDPAIPSTYVIRGQFFGPTTAWPTDVNFSVNTQYGQTIANLSEEDLTVNADGTFDIYVGEGPNPDTVSHPNYLTLTVPPEVVAPPVAPGQPARPAPAVNQILIRDTFGDWNSETPMALSVQRLSGLPAATTTPPSDAQLVAATVGVLSQGSASYINFITRATATPANTFAPVTVGGGGGGTLTTQLQTYGNFKLADDDALIITITPNRAGYFSVPVTSDWTITDVNPNVAADYGAIQISLNNKQAIANSDGTYTFVVSPTDPGVANWVSTGGLNQGTINLRFQDLDPSNSTNPTYTSAVVKVSDLRNPGVLPAETVYYTPTQRADQLAKRTAGYNNRFAPYPQV
jgi:hypothetical protein